MNELIDDSLEMMDDPDPDGVVEAVHETRKNCKKGRALLRLVRPALSDYSQANKALRDAARALGPIRDPHAMLETFDNLNPTGDSDHTLVRAELVKRSEAATEGILANDRQRLADARALLESVRGRSVAWELPDGFESVATGLEKTYRRGRKRQKDVLESPHDEAFHEWRKRVKYLWYQVRLLRDSAPSFLKPLARTLHDLSNDLGDAHDLSLLHQELEDWKREDLSVEIGSLELAAKERKSELEDRALSVGPLIYVEKTGRFVDRMTGYWKVWRTAHPT